MISTDIDDNALAWLLTGVNNDTMTWIEQQAFAMIHCPFSCVTVVFCVHCYHSGNNINREVYCDKKWIWFNLFFYYKGNTAQDPKSCSGELF